MDSSSRVTIEYTDPSEIYPLFASEFSLRLPLRELHWSSSSRPIRSISSLHIEFVSANGSNSKPEPTSTEGSSGAQDNGLPSKNEGVRKERRHQIPGLRRTPYLKIYLLYCNDIDTYRASSRKQLREWVKEHTAQSQSSASLSKQESHDAFEWLIIHVVPSSTLGPADNSMPSSNKGDSVVEKRPTSSRWSSRNSTSVIEKLRSEFNSTSKTAVDRVAQIQLVEPPVDGARQVDLRTDAGKNGWGDLVFKLKSLILASFDLRVSQYEEDIREREGQKKVFGWNFNTFFVLKEGLAMGFENMGLLDDALTVYQELAFGLRAVIEEQQNEGVEQQTAHFVDFTEDLYDDFKHATILNVNTIGEFSEAGQRQTDPGASILDTDRKPFRDLILSNKISFLDFQCYVFARQVSLSLQLANAVNKQVLSKRVSAFLNGPGNENDGQRDGADLSKPTDYEPENVILLAEVAKSSIEFITSTARVVRGDIQTAVIQSQARRVEERKIGITVHDAINNFVESWLFSACQCILEATSARSLAAQLGPLLRQLLPKTTITGSNLGGDQATKNDNVIHRNGLPARTSSLPQSNPAWPLAPPDEGFPSINFLDAAKLLAPGSPHAGAQDLAAERGDILALKRRVLGDLGVRHGGWQGKLANLTLITRTQHDQMGDIMLEEGTAQDTVGTPSDSIDAKAPTTAGVCNRSLLSALNSGSDFYREYEILTTSALAHYVVGGRNKAAEAMIADLAVARFQQKDYLSAASYFRQLVPVYAESSWSDLEITMLDTYAQCLKRINMIEDYVRIKLKTLAKMIHGRDWRPLHDAAGYLSDLISASKTLAAEVSAPMEDYFDIMDLNKYICHFADRDGFELPLKLRSLLPEDLQVESVRVKIVCTEGEPRSELWLATGGPQTVKQGLGEIALKSNMMQPGWYTLDEIHIQSSKIRFTLDLSPATEIPLFPRNRDSASSLKPNGLWNGQRLLIWPRSESLDARLTHYERMNLEQPKSIKVAVSAGWNNITKCKLSIRAASAGLRLHTAEAVVLDNNTAIYGKSQPGSMNLTDLLPNTTVNIKIPYSLETDPPEISVRALIDYTTLKGDFAFSCSASLSILLPLAINVQDSFKQAMLVSKFTISPSTPVPVRISSCYLEGNRAFRVTPPLLIETGIDVFPRQPLSLVSKIYQNSDVKDHERSARNKLFLKVEYRCLDEEIRTAAETVFLGDLATTPFQKFSRLLRRSLLAASHLLLATQDLEVVGIRREIHVGSFEEWEWDVVLAGIFPRDRAELDRWLRVWHEKTRAISLDADGVSTLQQHLTVPVEIPPMQVLQTAKLRRLARPSVSNTDSIPVPIGQGLPMELSVSHTRVWDLAQASKRELSALEFRYEVQANPDVWLIGGQRKGHFSAMETEVARFSLLLWPQKAGHLLLPSLEIQLLASAPYRSDGGESSARPTISCELDYQSLGDTILVVPDLVSTTVSLDPSGTGGGWLVESRSRSS